jgi:hypothetical protein
MTTLSTLDPVLEALRKGRLECPWCGAGWPLSIDNIEAMAVTFAAHMAEHYRISAQRTRVKDLSKPRCG